MLNLLFALAMSVASAEKPPPEFELRTADGPYGFGVGVVLGDPTGVSLMVRADDRHALQGAFGWSLIHENLTAKLDYLHTLGIVRFPEEPDLKLLAYVGGGASIHIDDTSTLGARVPLGVALLPAHFPVDVFAQVSPGLRLLPNTAFDIDAGLGARVFF